MNIKEEIEKKCKEIRFSGTVRIKKDNNLVYENSFGYSDRSNAIPNRITTRFASASGTKTFTAMAIGRLIDMGKLNLETPLLNCLKESFPGIDKDVTIDHLLQHSSGIYDYFDEELIEDFDNFELPIPNHKLENPKDYIPMLHGDMKFTPGARFSYSNSGFIFLALVIQELSGMDYSTFVEKEVFSRAGMNDSGFFRMDQLPEKTAFGYIEDEENWKTNFFSVPIKGGGDGGSFTTVEDLEKFWTSLLDGKIISADLAKIFTSPQIQVREDNTESYYGKGLWVRKSETDQKLIIEGCDAGVSCLSFFYSPETMYSILSNTTSGAYMINRTIQEKWSD